MPIYYGGGRGNRSKYVNKYFEKVTITITL